MKFKKRIRKGLCVWHTLREQKRIMIQKVLTGKRKLTR